MAVLTVREVTGNKPWDGKHGPMMDYYLVVTDDQGVDHPRVTLSQKPTTSAPAPGQQIDGTLEDAGQYGKKLKKTPAANGSFGGGGGGGRPKDPAERAAIAASVALREGREAVEQAVTMGLEKPADLAAHAALWKRYADFAFAFIDSKTKAAS